MATRPPRNADQLALGYLVYEFSERDREMTERKIRRNLSRLKLGAFDAARIAALRAFKDATREEIDRGRDSTYYLQQQGRYAERADFNVPRLVADLQTRFPAIPPERVAEFVPFAIFTYYLR